MVLLEAMAHRLPIVASDLDATRLVQLPDECYCTPADDHDLQRAIDRQLSWDFAPVDYDLTAYDWPTIARCTQQVYDSLFSSGR